MPVSKKQIGSLAASNILTLCANHHREVHFGCVEIVVTESGFDFQIAPPEPLGEVKSLRARQATT